jgi:chemotaxis signal transduction protein
MQGLSFHADGELYVVDASRVREVTLMTVTPVPSAPAPVVGIANMKGRVVTVLSLAAFLGRGREKSNGALTARTVVFKYITDSCDQMALLLDKPGDLVAISDDEILPPPVDSAFFISGIAETEDALYRIIDIEAIINRYQTDSKTPGAIQGGNT